MTGGLRYSVAKNVCDSENGSYLKIWSKASLGELRRPDTMLSSRLTLWVAEDTGVINISFSFRYLRPVRGVEGAKDLVYNRKTKKTYKQRIKKIDY